MKPHEAQAPDQGSPLLEALGPLTRRPGRAVLVGGSVEEALVWTRRLPLCVFHRLAEGPDMGHERIVDHAGRPDDDMALDRLALGVGAEPLDLIVHAVSPDAGEVSRVLLRLFADRLASGGRYVVTGWAGPELASPPADHRPMAWAGMAPASARTASSDQGAAGFLKALTDHVAASGPDAPTDVYLPVRSIAFLKDAVVLSRW